MKITYNVEQLPERKAGGGKQCEEVNAVIAFLANGQKKNMCIEYDDLKEAKNRLGSIQRYRKINKLQDVFDVYRVEKKIYVVKTPERRKA